jgi:hypothetical protein
VQLPLPSQVEDGVAEVPLHLPSLHFCPLCQKAQEPPLHEPVVPQDALEVDAQRP